jgi:CheY-like chemotaxis protein
MLECSCMDVQKCEFSGQTIARKHAVTILIVEDDAVQRRQMSRVLKAESYEVLQAAEGREAIRVLREQEVDAVLTDRKMAGMGGDELVRYIKQNLPRVPVAIITAYPEDPESPPPDAILSKPFGESELKKLARSLTKKG